MARINLEESPETKAEWQQYAEKEYGGNLSRLIRRSVEKEINGGHGDGEPQNIQELSTLSDKLDRIQRTLQSLDSRVQTLESENRTDPETEELANNVFGLLPTEADLAGFVTRSIDESEETKKREKLAGEREIDPETDRWLADSGRPDVFAKILGEPEYRIREGIEKLLEETHMVYSTERDGRTVYYKLE